MLRPALLLLLSTAVAAAGHGSCYKRSPTRHVEHVTSPRPHEQAGFSAAALPTDLDWRTNQPAGTSPLVTISRNQHIPNYCGACWSFASTSSLSDRFRIMNKGAFPQTDLSMQYVYAGR